MPHASKLSNSDYIKILSYYGQIIPKSKRLLKQSAENILAKKMCSCIKKISPAGEESRAIGICSKTVLKNKNLTRGRFTCRNNRQITGLKKTQRNLNIGISKKRM